MSRVKQLFSAAALTLGTIALLTLLWGLLDLARIQQSHPGREFQDSASFLRMMAVVEILAVAVSASVIMWRRRSPIARLVTLAIVVWGLSLFDFLFLAQAGVVPR